MSAEYDAVHDAGIAVVSVCVGGFAAGPGLERFYALQDRLGLEGGG